MRDAGDESINNERKEELLWQVDAELTLQNEVREALSRIDNETFGKCLIDGASKRSILKGRRINHKMAQSESLALEAFYSSVPWVRRL